MPLCRPHRGARRVCAPLEGAPCLAVLEWALRYGYVLDRPGRGDGTNRAILLPSLHVSNVGAFVNDAFGTRRDDAAYVKTRAARCNVRFVEVEIEGTRGVFFMALRDIAPGETLLCDYGDGFWRGHEQRAAAIAEIVELKNRLCAQVSHLLESTPRGGSRSGRAFRGHVTDATHVRRLPRRQIGLVARVAIGREAADQAERQARHEALGEGQLGAVRLVREMACAARRRAQH